MITFRMTFIANSELCELRVFAGHIPKFGCGASRARSFVSFVVNISSSYTLVLSAFAGDTPDS
jgi:hypothetical protein